MERRDCTHTVPPTTLYGPVVSHQDVKKLLWMVEGAPRPATKATYMVLDPAAGGHMHLEAASIARTMKRLFILRGTE
jgi:hypothetical protein